MRKQRKMEYESPQVSEMLVQVADFFADLKDSNLGDPNVFGGGENDDILEEIKGQN